jgi:hypothetical protein
VDGDWLEKRADLESKKKLEKKSWSVEKLKDKVLGLGDMITWREGMGSVKARADG